MERKKRKGGHNCVIYGCKSGYSDSTTTHCLPTDPFTKQKWLEFINASYPTCYPHLKPSTATRVCSKHFPHRAYNHLPSLQSQLGGHVSKPRLKTGAVPSLDTTPTEVSRSTGGGSRQDNYWLVSLLWAHVVLIFVGQGYFEWA